MDKYIVIERQTFVIQQIKKRQIILQFSSNLLSLQMFNEIAMINTMCWFVNLSMRIIKLKQIKIVRNKLNEKKYVWLKM